MIVNRVVNQTAVYLVSFYQRVISPYLIPSCRFTPSCSEYSKQAFTKYGFFYALYLSCRRILKCHPFHPGGVDRLP